ncbi:MAG: sodium/proton-translocating pyrophosphatase [Phycisphaerales bacterium]|nr:MAG: sodium/proton-translocating pyrophosphatase [Phycisphaerales bacterium]
MTDPLSLAVIDIPTLFYLAPIAGVAALLTAFALTKSIMKQTEGDDEMVRIAEAVRQGAKAYLARQFKVVAIVFVVIVALLAVLGYFELEPYWAMVGVPVAGFLSAVCGWFGMKTATNASARTAAACRTSLNDGLRVAFRAGAVMGLTCVGFAIIDVSFWFFIFSNFGESLGIGDGDPKSLLSEMVAILISFKMGASLQALFARVGGGIFTKAADVGADLVGKVEAGIPEDDARNPAVIADNVGDNVGDVAGMGADLYESYYSSIIAAIGLGVAAAFSLLALNVVEQTDLAIQMAVVPIALAGIGIFASIVGVFSVRTKEDASFAQLLKALHGGVYIASAFIIAAAFAVPYFLLGNIELPDGSGMITWWRFSFSIIAGLVAGLFIAWWTEYCTSYEHKPTRRIAMQALTGPATVIISGIAEGMRSTWACLLAVVVAILVAYNFAGGSDNFLMGLYGVGIAAVGMLSTLGITLATDAYGPIADNAGGNAEMSGQDPKVRERTDLLDSLGNTTAATGKGFAIGSAALTALALLAAYVQVVQTQLEKQSRRDSTQIVQTMTAEERAAQGIGENDPYAVYSGHRKFALIIPDGLSEAELARGSTDRTLRSGAMLIIKTVRDPIALAAIEQLERGVPMPVYGSRNDFDATTANLRGNELAMSERLLVAMPGVGANAGATVPVEIVPTRRSTISDILDYYDASLTNPNVLGGLFIGVMLTFLFCALTMDAVGRAANTMMTECRRQFAQIRAGLRAKGMGEAELHNPDNWPKSIEVDGKTYPDYPACVDIATTGALKEMVVPSLLVVAVPVAAGLILGVAGTMGILAGGLICGFAVAVFMANAGGAWDNAKKLLESYGKITADDVLNNPEQQRKIPAELLDAMRTRAEDFVQAGKPDAIVYGKGSEDHKATVVGDTVGDPFKDTSGPSLNILIKLLSSVAVVAAGLVVKFSPEIGALLGLS